MSTKKDNIKRLRDSEFKISRSTMMATWVGVMASIVLGIISLWYTFASNNKFYQDDLVILNVDRVDDQPIQLSDWYTSYPDRGEVLAGLAPMYWRMVLVNNGRSVISVMNYELTQVSGDLIPGSMYGMMDAGLYECSKGFEPIDIWASPIRLEPGGTVTLCPRIGILMEPNAYAVAKEEFGAANINNQEELMMYLWSQGLDMYGNRIVSPDQDGVYKFFNSNIKGQTFKVIFTTSKGSKVATIISPIEWYVFTGFFIP